MSYNTQLQTNNETIQSLIDTVNALPDAPAAVDQATPTITVSSAGLITASATQSAGLVSAGTKSITKQLTTQAAKTVTPNTYSQTAVASGRYTTGAVTVAAIPSTYVKPTTTKGATTYTPKTTNQTIAAGTYCSGAQTIKGDANLVAGNIKSGVSIFGVTGTYAGTTEDLDAVITELETKTATLNTTLEGKASGGGSASSGTLETGTITATTKMQNPAAYDYSYDLSVIPNIDSKLMISLIVPTEFTGQIVAIFTRNDMNSDYTICLGRISSMGFSYNESTKSLEVAEAAPLGGWSMDTVTYYAM